MKNSENSEQQKPIESEQQRELEIIKLTKAGVEAQVYTPEDFDSAKDYETVIVWPGLGAGDSDEDAGGKIFKDLGGKKRVVYMNTQAYGGLDKKTKTPIKDFAELARDELLSEFYPLGEGEEVDHAPRPKFVHLGHSLGGPMAYHAAKKGDELVLAQGALFDVFTKTGMARIARQGAIILKLCVEANQALVRDAEEGVREGVLENSKGIGKAALSLVLDGKAMALKRVFDELVAGVSDEEIVKKDLKSISIIASERDHLTRREAKRRAKALAALDNPQKSTVLGKYNVEVSNLDHVPLSTDSLINAIARAIIEEKPPKQESSTGGPHFDSAIQ